MIEKLIALFKEVQPEQKQHTLDLACAVLLVEIMKADYELHTDEQAALQKHLEEIFSLSAQDSALLFEEAKSLSSNTNDLYQYTEVINQHWKAEDKFKLIQGLWKVAFSDNKLDKYEEYTIRKISDLLYVPHSEFIRAKLSVQPNS